MNRYIKHLGEKTRFDSFNGLASSRFFNRKSTQSWIKRLNDKKGQRLFDEEVVGEVFHFLEGKFSGDEGALQRLNVLFKMVSNLKVSIDSDIFSILKLMKGDLSDVRYFSDSNEAVIKSSIGLVLSDILGVDGVSAKEVDDIFNLIKSSKGISKEVEGYEDEAIFDFIDGLKSDPFFKGLSDFFYANELYSKSEAGDYSRLVLKKEVIAVKIVLKIQSILKEKMSEEQNQCFLNLFIPYVFTKVDKDKVSMSSKKVLFHSGAMKFSSESEEVDVNLSGAEGSDSDSSGFEKVYVEPVGDKEILLGDFIGPFSDISFLTDFIRLGALKGALNADLERLIREKFFIDFKKSSDENSDYVLVKLFDLFMTDEGQIKGVVLDAFNKVYENEISIVVQKESKHDDFKIFIETPNLKSEKLDKAWGGFWSKASEKRTSQDFAQLIQSLSNAIMDEGLEKVMNTMVASGKFKKTNSDNIDKFFKCIKGSLESSKIQHLEGSYNGSKALKVTLLPSEQRQLAAEELRQLLASEEANKKASTLNQLLFHNETPGFFAKLKVYVKGLFWRVFSRNIQSRSVNQLCAMIYSGKKLTEDNLRDFVGLVSTSRLEVKGMRGFLFYCNFHSGIEFQNKSQFFNDINQSLGRQEEGRDDSGLTVSLPAVVNTTNAPEGPLREGLLTDTSDKTSTSSYGSGT